MQYMSMMKEIAKIRTHEEKKEQKQRTTNKFY
jgi:hypothetical protein